LYKKVVWQFDKLTNCKKWFDNLTNWQIVILPLQMSGFNPDAKDEEF
jgi:hypothetical protein